MIHARRCGGCSRSPPCVPLSLLCWSWRLHNEHQYYGWHQYCCSHLRLRLVLYLHDICTRHRSPVTIPEFVLLPCLVSYPEIGGPTIQGSKFSWSLKICKLKHGSRADATCYGRVDASHGRDERALRWLVGNMTEDAEMVSFIMAIPGSFNTQWGREVWKVSNTIGDKKSRSQNASAGPLTDRNHVPFAIPLLVVRPSRRGTVRSVFDKIIRLVRTHVVTHSRTDTMALLSELHTAPSPPITDTTPCAGSVHVLLTCWRYARTALFFQKMNC